MSEIHRYRLSQLTHAEIQILRLDQQVNGLVSGNKIYKLKPWVEKVVGSHRGLLSCGGAHSNHLHALAAVGQQYHIPTFALVRGLEKTRLTATLLDCQAMGMELIKVSRSDYRLRYERNFSQPFQKEIDVDTLWVPEGGTDLDAIIACEKIGDIINTHGAKHVVDAVWLAVGSGGTLAGVARSLALSINIYAVPVMKHWKEVKSRIESFLTEEQSSRIIWLEKSAYGGFGRFNATHIAFMQQIEQETKIKFDPVYTSKVMRRLIDAYQNNETFHHHPMVIHTGGLQGRRSVASRINSGQHNV